MTAEWITLVNDVAFPILVSIYFMYGQATFIKKNTEVTNSLRDAILRLTERMK